MARGNVTVICLRCGKEKRHSARGLCGACKTFCSKNGYLDRYPLRNEKAKEQENG